MNKILVATIFSLFILTVTALGQTESPDYESGAFPDTIKVGREAYKRIYSLDSIEGVIIDTLTNPNGFIFRKPSSSRDVELYFAREKENYFLVYQLGSWSSLSGFKFERVNFNGTGTKELVMINTQERKHRFNYPEDEDYCEQWLSIWNLDSVEMLALFHNYTSHHLWQKDSVVMKTCFNLIPTIKRNEITFNQSGKCNECNEAIDVTIKKPLQIKYKLIANGLIKTSESGGMYHQSKMGYTIPNVTDKYKLYTDKGRGFSFQIPVEWTIQKDAEGELEDIAVPVERDSVNPQYSENRFFTISRNEDGVCDSLYMTREGFSKNESAFCTYGIDYINSGEPEDIYRAIPIKGKNWKGYVHRAPCGQLTNERRDFHGDICEEIYFCDGKHIVKIYTSGNELNEKAREKLIESFKFF